MSISSRSPSISPPRDLSLGDPFGAPAPQASAKSVNTSTHPVLDLNVVSGSLSDDDVREIVVGSPTLGKPSAAEVERKFQVPDISSVPSAGGLVRTKSVANLAVMPVGAAFSSLPKEISPTSASSIGSAQSTFSIPNRAPIDSIFSARPSGQSVRVTLAALPSIKEEEDVEDQPVKKTKTGRVAQAVSLAATTAPFVFRPYPVAQSASFSLPMASSSFNFSNANPPIDEIKDTVMDGLAARKQSVSTQVIPEGMQVTSRQQDASSSAPMVLSSFGDINAEQKTPTRKKEMEDIPMHGSAESKQSVSSVSMQLTPQKTQVANGQQDAFSASSFAPMVLSGLNAEPTPPQESKNEMTDIAIYGSAEKQHHMQEVTPEKQVASMQQDTPDKDLSMLTTPEKNPTELGQIGGARRQLFPASVDAQPVNMQKEISVKPGVLKQKQPAKLKLSSSRIRRGLPKPARGRKMSAEEERQHEAAVDDLIKSMDSWTPSKPVREEKLASAVSQVAPAKQSLVAASVVPMKQTAVPASSLVARPAIVAQSAPGSAALVSANSTTQPTVANKRSVAPISRPESPEADDDFIQKILEHGGPNLWNEAVRRLNTHNRYCPGDRTIRDAVKSVLTNTPL